MCADGRAGVKRVEGEEDIEESGCAHVHSNTEAQTCSTRTCGNGLAYACSRGRGVRCVHVMSLTYVYVCVPSMFTRDVSISPVCK